MNTHAGRAPTTMKSSVKRLQQICGNVSNNAITTGFDSLRNKTVITHHPRWRFRNTIRWSEAVFFLSVWMAWLSKLFLLELLLERTLEKWQRTTSDGAKTNDSLYSANIRRQQRAAEGDPEDGKYKYTFWKDRRGPLFYMLTCWTPRVHEGQRVRGNVQKKCCPK